MKKITTTFWMFFLNNTNKKIFCILVNFRNFIKKKNISIGYQNEEYFLKDNENLWYFKNKYRLLRNIDGLSKRAQYLLDVYQINKINIEDRDLIIDIGANYGEFYNVFNLLLKKNIKYISIEPSIDCYKSIIKSIPKQTHFNFAIFNKNSEKTFYLSEDSADSSLIEPKKFVRKVDVKTKTLNQIIKSDVKLLKVEAEGAEPEILLGLRDVKFIIDYIVVDVSFERGKLEQSTKKRCLTILKSYGYTVKSECKLEKRIILLFNREK